MEDDIYNVSIDALSFKTKNCISALLNPTKVIPTMKGLPRDWQGLAELVGIDGRHMPDLQTKSDKTHEILVMWKCKDKEKSTIKQLMHHLEEMDRFDVLDDATKLIIEDISKYRERLPNNIQGKSLLSNADAEILTVDDAYRLKQGLSPQTYDAFVLFAEEDIAFATELIDTIEKQYGAKLCVKDRDMVGGIVESDAIMKLITERCNRLIVIISDAFFHSPWNKFFFTYAQKLGIELQQRRIIPCQYTHCEIPEELRCYYTLNYLRMSKFYNFWEKLYNSICTVDSAVPNREGFATWMNDGLLSGPTKQKKENVKFNSESNISLPTPPDTPIEIAASTSDSSKSVQEEPKDGKINRCLFKVKNFLGGKVSRSHSDVTNKDKKKFWNRAIKSKVAVAN